MAGISRYERLVLGITAAFLLLTGGWFLVHQNTAQPYQVTTSRSEEAPPADEPEPQPDERPDSLLAGEVINVNTADVLELGRLPGIGEKRAQAIVAYREEHGPFQTVEELKQVEGIGPGILADLDGYVTVETAEG